MIWAKPCLITHPQENTQQNIDRVYTVKSPIQDASKPPNLMFVVSSCSCRCPIQVLRREWRYSCSSADRRCSNFIWMINNFIAYQGATSVRDLTVAILMCITYVFHICHISMTVRYWKMTLNQMTFFLRCHYSECISLFTSLYLVYYGSEYFSRAMMYTM